MTPKARRTLRQLQKTVTQRDVPEAEQREATAYAMQQAAQNAQGLMSPDDLKRVMKMQRQLTVAKAAQLSTVNPQSVRRPGVAKVDVPLSNELFTTSRLVLARPNGLDFPQLRAIVKHDPMLRAIVGTRIAQVQRFLRPSSEEWKPGFNLRFRDTARKITDDDKPRFDWCRRYLMNCGAEFDPRKRQQLERDSLSAFVAKHVDDSLTLDAAPVEIVKTPSGRPHGFVAVDGARVFLAEPLSRDLEDLPWDTDVHIPDEHEILAVLAFEGRPINTYTHQELLYPIRNPSSSVYNFGYGQPEAEELLEVVTAFLNAMSLNARGFTSNSIPQGLLSIVGEFDSDEVEEFKAEWDAQVAGLSNRWRLPVFFSENKEGAVNFTPIGANFTEMMFERWMTFLVAIKCALFKIDPEEVNFSGFTNKPSTLAGSDTEERLASSKDKGLWPLLTRLADTINEVLYQLDPEVEFYWTGLEPDQQAKKGEAEKVMLVKEYRASMGMPEIGIEELDNAPMNPSLQGVYQTVLQGKQQEAQMAQQGAQGGDPNAVDPNLPQGIDPSQLTPEQQQQMQAQGVDPEQQANMTGETRDVDSDGEAEHGYDENGDGKADKWVDTDEDGNRKFLSHDGDEYRVEPYQAEDSEDEQSDDQKPQKVAKAAEVQLTLWP